MVHKWSAPALICAVLLMVITGCISKNPQVSPTPVSQASSNTSQTRTTFVNFLIYNIPEMYTVTMKIVEYQSFEDPSIKLPMYIFYPSDEIPAKPLPVVIFPNAWKQNGRWSNFNHTLGLLNNFEGWGRVIAANGIIAVAYETTNPDDLEAVVSYLQENNSNLGIDTSRIGLFAASFNATLQGAYIYQENRDFVKFAVFYYGSPQFSSSPGKESNDAFCLDYDCYSSELPQITQLRTDLPVLLIRAGKDSNDNLADIDYYIQQAEEQRVPLTVVRFDDASQRFEWNRWWGASNPRGIEIMKQTIEFMQKYAVSP